MINTSHLIKQFPHYLALMRMDKPIGTLLLLWPTWWALWLASDGAPSALMLWVFSLGVLVMRSAGCVMNDYADREIDPRVQRTQQRPLAAGAVQPQEALCLFVLLCLLALALLLMLPQRVWAWSLLAMALTIVYPFMKRFIQAPQLVLSLAFSTGMLMAYVAYDKAFDLPLVLIYATNFLWVLMYDTQYAMSDRQDDLAIGVKSTAILFGDYDKKVIAALQICIVLLLLALMQVLNLPLSFLLSVVMVVVLFVHQQGLIRQRQRLPCFQAFLNNAWVGAIIWFGLLSAL